MPVHLIGEALDRAANAFGQHDGDIVRRFDHQHLERIVDGDLRAGAQSPSSPGDCATALAETVRGWSRVLVPSLTACRVT